MPQKKIVNEYAKIALFSDDLVFIEIMKRIFEKLKIELQYTVYKLFADASHVFKNQKFDLILVDNLIVGRSSYELIYYLRINQKISCPIFYFGVTDYQGDKRSLLIGANVFINKPFNPEDVTKTIQETLKNKIK